MSSHDREGREGVLMEPLAVRWPRGPIRWLFSRNPLVRGVDRLEAVIVLITASVALMAVPVAGAVGTAVHDSRSQVYAQQAQSRHPWTATVTGDAISADELDITAGIPAMPRQTITVPARWVVDGSEHRGMVNAAPTVALGDRVDIWIDDDGRLVGEPAPQSRAPAEAVAAALGVWLGITAGVAVVGAFARVALNHARDARWQYDIDSLQCRRG
ncbi:hypothetical protein H7I95_11395 [Mycolicibacterium elephantis]|nr:hypothetical protein [Mycolicibacterium elephantis]